MPSSVLPPRHPCALVSPQREGHQRRPQHTRNPYSHSLVCENSNYLGPPRTCKELCGPTTSHLCPQGSSASATTEDHRPLVRSHHFAEELACKNAPLTSTMEPRRSCRCTARAKIHRIATVSTPPPPKGQAVLVEVAS